MKITEPIIKEAQEKMTKAEDSLRRELGNIRAGRANASLLNRINVEYYGAPTPLNQMARRLRGGDVATFFMVHNEPDGKVVKWRMGTKT